MCFHSVPCALGSHKYISKVCAFTAPVITSTATCKSLFSVVVCCSPGIVCAVEWRDVTFITADVAFRGCARQDDWDTWTQVHGRIFVGVAVLHKPC